VAEFDDAAFFKQHRDRCFHIREPKDQWEFDAEFKTLGSHLIDRRAIIAVRTIGGIIRIPFLKFADESIEDDDRTLKPIVDEMMGQARANYAKKMI
jgi:hypothetical protein